MQQPVYYVSKTMVDVETRYLPLEKLMLALVNATRKLSHYFQAYTVYVLTGYPLQSLLKRSDIRYRPRSLVKGQIFADFFAEFSPKNEG